MNDADGTAIRCFWEGKICYTAREAGFILNAVRHRCNFNGRRICRGKNMPRRKYYCERCQFYHLTHYPFRYRDTDDRIDRKKRAFRKIRNDIRDIYCGEDDCRGRKGRRCAVGRGR